MANDLALERQRLDNALGIVAAAQREVDRALQELVADRPRAEKTIIGEVLRSALDKLEAARRELEELRQSARA